MRAGTNLSKSRKKSSVIPNRNRRAVPKNRITERDLTDVADLFEALRKLADRFDLKRWDLVHRRICR